MPAASTARRSLPKRALWILAGAIPLALGMAVFQAGKKRPRQVLGLGGVATEVAYSPSGMLVCASANGLVQRWREDIGKWRSFPPPRTYYGGGNAPARLRFSPDGKRLYAGGTTAPAGFSQPAPSIAWDAETKRPQFLFNPAQGAAFDVSADGETAAIGFWSGVAICPIGQKAALRKRNTAMAPDDKWFQETRLLRLANASGLALSPDGSRVAVCGISVQVFDVASGKRIGSVPAPAAPPAGGFSVPFGQTLHSAAFSPDGAWLAVATPGAILILASDGSTHSQASLPVPGAPAAPGAPATGPVFTGPAAPRPIAWAPDARRLAVGGPDVRLFSAPDLKPERVLAGAGGVAFSPDGSKLATGHPTIKGVLEWQM